MKSQIIMFSIAMLAIKSPQTVLSIKSHGNASKTISKTQSTDFSFFVTHRQCRGISIAWGINSMTDVGFFMVQRTSDDPNDQDAVWEDLNYVPGTADRWYRWTDENVPHSCVSYRIAAYLYDGSTITSNISRVRTGRH